VPPSDGSAPARNRLVFVHGAGGTSHGWDLQRLAFPNGMAVDLPGRGGSGPARRRIEEYAAWLHDTPHQFGQLPAVLVGHSMGGAIALAFALAYPGEASGIVLVATGARLRVDPAILGGLAADYAPAVEGIVTRSLAPDADPRLARRLKEAMMAVPQDVTLGDFQACDAFDVMQRLEEIRAPALVIAGREDRMTPPRYSEFLHAHLRASHLVWIEGAGHMVHVERPREVNEAIQRFLRGVGTDAAQE